MDYQEGSFETTTWNPTSTVETRRTRDGLTLTYTYDAANRPLSVVQRQNGNTGNTGNTGASRLFEQRFCATAGAGIERPSARPAT